MCSVCMYSYIICIVVHTVGVSSAADDPPIPPRAIERIVYRILQEELPRLLESYKNYFRDVSTCLYSLMATM